jgi:hypothetical protein
MADEKALQDHTVAELDELAAGVEDYPASGNKAEKIAALEAAGVTGTPLVLYRLRLRTSFFDEGVEPTASFQASGQAVELDADNPVYETADRSLWLGLRDLPFLDDEGEVA